MCVCVWGGVRSERSERARGSLLCRSALPSGGGGTSAAFFLLARSMARLFTSSGVGTLPHFVEAHWDPPACGTLGRKAGPAAEGGALSPSKQQARPRSRPLYRRS